MTDHPLPDPARYRVDQELIDGLRALFHQPVPAYVIHAAKDLMPAEPATAALDAEDSPSSGARTAR